MKRILLCVLIVLAALSSSCDDSINPEASSQTGYVLYCIIDTDTTFQTAYLSQTYDVSGTDPSTNTTNPSISNAEVAVICQGNKYLFTDSTVSRTDTSRYKDNFSFYYNNKLNLKSTYSYDVAYPCSVKVKLPNNKTLVSAAESIPTGDLFFDEYVFSFPVVDNVKMCTFTWSFFSTKNSLNKYYFLPKLEINYSKVVNGVATRMKYKVPYLTVYANNEEILTYPKVSKTNSVSYNKQYIIDALNKISEGDSNKGNYIIHNLMMSVILMDKNVAAYYASSSTYNDEFSVRIDAADYSNITGGYGLFGLYATKKKNVKLDQAYILGFGYQYDPKL
jgi:hypothetical protein